MMSEPPLTIRAAKQIRRPVVYGLSDAAGIFYVGQTRSASSRFQAHAECRGKNEALKGRIRSAGKDLRVVILCNDPADLNEAERREIGRRAGLVNLMGADDARWSLSDTKPWAAGTGVKSPVAYALQCCRPEVRTVVRAKLRAMTDAERCSFEVGTLQSLPELLQRRFGRWLEVTREKMIACMESANVAA